MRLTLWIVAAVAPVYSYFYINTQLEGARYLYPAECAWALLVADLVWTVTSPLPVGMTRAAIVAALVVVSASTLHRELGVWSRAADVRDRVLTEARLSLDRSRCASGQFSNVPESVDGAYVFRNGLREALNLPDDADGAVDRCRFEWHTGAFVPAR